MALQHELVEYKKRMGEYKSRAEIAEIEAQTVTEAQEEALKEVEKLTKDLKEERIKSDKLGHEIRQIGNAKRTEKDVNLEEFIIVAYFSR